MTPFSPNLTLLQFEKLNEASRFLPADTEVGAPKPRGVPELGEIRSSIQSALGRQEWLLVEEQHIELPSSSLDQSRELFSLADFVIEADKAMERDLTAAAFDSDGKRLELDDSQQLEIHETGQLSVPSVLLENQTHVWQVNPWFFQGRSTIYNLFLEGVGKCIDHLAVYTWSNPDDPHPYLPSWPSSFRYGFLKAYRNVNRALRQLVSVPFRPPMHEDVEYVLSQVELAYVRYHLENQGIDSRLCDPCFLRDSVWENVTSVWDLAEECRPTTKNKKDALYATVRVTREREKYEESVQRRQLIYDEDVALESPLSARREANRATKKWKEDSLTALIDHLANQTDALFHVEAARLEASRVENEIERSDRAELQELKKAHEARMKKKRPLLALGGAWLKRSTKTYISQQRKEQATSQSRRVGDILVGMDGLQGEAEKHRLRLDFRSTQRKNLQDSLRRQRKSITSTFSILQLNPKKWSVDYSTSQVNRYKKVKVSLDKWFWRVPYTWYSFLQVAVSLAASSFHFLCNGSLSMRALFSPQAFYGLQRPSFSGGLEEDPDSLTPSLISRLRSFFAALRRDRRVFEAQPDVGLVGKPVQRIFFKLKATLTATFGSAMIVVFMVVGSALCTLLSGAVVVLSPGIALLCTLAMSIYDLGLYDRAVETSGVVWKLLTATYQVICPGILQGILATFRHVVFHPIVGSLHFVGAFVRFASGSLRDAMTGRVLSRFAKIPVGETFLAKRTHGPGVSSTRYYRLPLTAAKAAVEVVLQQALVDAHIRFRKAELKEPFHRYDEFASRVLSPFGYGATLEINSPSRICWKLVSTIQKESRRHQNDSTISFEDNTESLWHELNKRILGANPDSKKESHMKNIGSKGRDQIEEPTENAYELKVREQVKYHAANMACDIHYDVMALRTGQLLAELWLLQEFKATRMSKVVAIPHHARGQFRLLESELQELWSFALTRTKLYADQLQSDLNSSAKDSAFREQLEDTSEEIFSSFRQADEAHGTRDIAFVASSLLSTLLGGDVMLESLEDTDKTIVIKPTYSEVDEHLVFWNSLA